MTKVILVDMDGVLEDLVSAWTSALNSKYGLNVNPDEVAFYNLHRYYLGLSDEEYYGVLHEPEFWKTVKPIEGANEYLRKLKDDGYWPVLLTGTYYKTLRPKMDYCLFDKFDVFKWSDVIVTGLKNLVQGDVIIDDSPENLRSSPAKLKILFSRPYNERSNPKSYGAVRANSWEEAYRIIKGNCV